MPIVAPVTVINTIKPANALTFGVVEDIDLIGGFRVVASLAERDALDVQMLKVGMTVYVVATATTYRLDDDSPVTWSAVSNAGFVVDQFIAIAAQTVFALSAAPAVPASALVFVNGQQQKHGADFSIVGTTLTWLTVDFSMQAGDEVSVFF